MSAFDKIFKRIVSTINNYNSIRTKTEKWHGDNLILSKAKIFGDVIVGKNCKIMGGVHIDAGSAVRIGDFTSLNGPNMDIYAKINTVTIGNFCSIARNVSIQEFNHRMDSLTGYFIFQNIFGESVSKDVVSKGSIEIGHDVWIGAHSVILSGAKIGNGAIIAANSVVTGEIPPFAIAGGSPAKVIKYRFEREIINQIQELQWWFWSPEKIKKNRSLFEGSLEPDKIKQVII
jgi:virginiamycin A acetyltransferase